MLIHQFTKNEVGVDFICGDIHGHFDMLEKELTRNQFNTRVDRLFVTGDLINRGPFSGSVSHYLAQPWFHSVLGNHEQYLLDNVKGYYSDAEFARKGGSWYVNLRRNEKEAIAQQLSTLPLGIQIETARGCVGVVHAEVPHDDWQQFIQMSANIKTPRDYQIVATSALWLRDRINTLRCNPVLGIQHVFVGHSPQEKIRELGNVSYLDGGAYKENGRVNMIPITQFGI
jgi:serine/threonine protein phosphatase 1